MPASPLALHSRDIRALMSPSACVHARAYCVYACSRAVHLHIITYKRVILSYKPTLASLMIIKTPCSLHASFFLPEIRPVKIHTLLYTISLFPGPCTCLRDAAVYVLEMQLNTSYQSHLFELVVTNLVDEYIELSSSL